jgi:hypothetical protein
VADNSRSRGKILDYRPVLKVLCGRILDQGIHIYEARADRLSTKVRRPGLRSTSNTENTSNEPAEVFRTFADGQIVVEIFSVGHEIINLELIRNCPQDRRFRATR